MHRGKMLQGDDFLLLFSRCILTKYIFVYEEMRGTLFQEWLSQASYVYICIHTSVQDFTCTWYEKWPVKTTREYSAHSTGSESEGVVDFCQCGREIW